MSGNTAAHPECEVKTLMTTVHTAVQVRHSELGLAGIDRSSWKGHTTGRHEKAPVRCPCSQLTALHGVPQTLIALCFKDVRKRDRKYAKIVKF